MRRRNRVAFKAFRREQRATGSADLKREVAVQTAPSISRGSDLSMKEGAATQTQTSSSNESSSTNELEALYKELGRAEDEVQILQFQLDSERITAQAAQQERSNGTKEREERAVADELASLRIQNRELTDERVQADEEIQLLVDKIDSLQFQLEGNITAGQAEQMASACGIKTVTAEALASGACRYATSSDEEEKYDLRQEDRPGKSIWDY